MPANGRSLNPVFSADGQTPVWESWANNLAGQDINQWCNPYILQTFGTNLTAGAGQSFATAGFGVSSLASLGLARKLLDGFWHDRLSEVLSSFDFDRPSLAISCQTFTGTCGRAEKRLRVFFNKGIGYSAG